MWNFDRISNFHFNENHPHSWFCYKSTLQKFWKLFRTHFEYTKHSLNIAFLPFHVLSEYFTILTRPLILILPKNKKVLPEESEEDFLQNFFIEFRIKIYIFFNMSFNKNLIKSITSLLRILQSWVKLQKKLFQIEFNMNDVIIVVGHD